MTYAEAKAQRDNASRIADRLVRERWAVNRTTAEGRYIYDRLTEQIVDAKAEVDRYACEMTASDAPLPYDVLSGWRYRFAA